jgi:dTDP-4-amino-4,6-dideoxygalactose transaminase
MTPRVPLLDLKLQFASIRSDVLAAIERVCDSQQFIMGPDVQALEAELASAIGVTHAIGVSSGTDALLVSLMALGIGAGDEVIVPTFSFFATAGCVSRVGATPVFVDVEPHTLMLDPDAVRSAVTERTRAIIPVHLYGLCADMDSIHVIAAAHGLHVIEDAAQAIGATYHGRQAGTMGTLGCFSFFPSKNLGACGDAGLVTTNDETLAKRVRRLRIHGSEPKYYHHDIGGNFRIDTLQAAVLRVKLPHLASWTAGRRANAARYGELFDAAGATGRVRLPEEPQGLTHIYHQYVVRLSDRDRVRKCLAERGVATEVYYPVPFHRQECFAHLPQHDRSFPNADAAARDVLALPIYPELTRAQQEHVVSSLAACLG